MASEVASLSVRIGADITGLTGGLKQADSAIGAFASKVGGGVAALAKIGVAAAAAGAALTAHLVKNSMDAIGAQADLAKALGTTSSSLAVLQRAGELAGVEFQTIQNAGQKLAVNLGKASEAGSAQADTLKRLGLNAAEVAALPLDQRIMAINDAIRENIPAVEQAATAAELFGAKNAAVFQLLDGETMSEAARQAQLFGTALSEVDAAKVEMAGDAMSVFGMAGDGIIKQLTVQLAPVLKAIGDLFLEMAEDAGGFGNIAQKAFDGIITGAQYVMNFIDGIKRTFELVGNGIMAVIATVVKYIAQTVGVTLNALSVLPGIDFTATVKSLAELDVKAQGMFATTRQNITDAITEPLAGDKFVAFVESARSAGQAAAEAAVEAREAVAGQGGDAPTAEDTKALDKQRADLAAKLEAIREANLSELQLAEEKFIAENEVIRAGLEMQQITRDEAMALSMGAAQRYSDAKLAIDQRRADEELRIEQQKEAAKRAILSSAFGGLTTLMNSESRKMFEIGKAAAISQALVSTYTGMTKALELGFPLGPIAAGAIALTGFANVASIRSQSFGGGGSGSASAASNTQAINAANTPVGAPGQGEGGNTPRTLVNITLEGQSFGRDQVVGLVDTIRQMQSEGSLVSFA